MEMNTNRERARTAELEREARQRINQLGKVSDEEVSTILDELISGREDLLLMSAKEKIHISQKIFLKLRREFGILQPLIEDKTISEIMVNGIDDVFIEKKGKIERYDLQFDSVDELEETIRKMAAGVKREINELNPIVDARLPQDNSRINGVYKNIAIGGPVLTIRKFPEKAMGMADLIRLGTITEEAAEYLKILVKAGYNIFICGGTSSGKTTFLNILSNYIPGDERVVVIEDSAELQIKNIENIVRMECRNANFEGKGKIDMQALIRTSLRMRPDRIIVGEVRGEEVISMIQAMNTGHSGSICTGHGNSVRGMFKRLEAMFLQGADFPTDAIRNQISEGIDIMVHMGRMADKKRKVLEIAEVMKNYEGGEIKTNSLFKYSGANGLVRTGAELINTEKLIMRGIELP